MLFHKNIDWLVAAFPVAALVFLYYGAVPALITLIVIAGLVFAKPLDSIFSSSWSRIFFAVSLALLISPIWRLMFPDGFCLDAPWSTQGAVRSHVSDNYAGLELQIGNQLVDGLVDACKRTLWSQNMSEGWPRDIAMPLVGLVGLAVSYLKRDRDVNF